MPCPRPPFSNDAVWLVVAQVRREFPGVVAWYGWATRSWWAYVPLRDGARLVEAPTPRVLREAIENAAHRPFPKGPL
ncbi:hypothetical protein GCM10023085_54410 [Actinomadura viridis]|uniref:Uncharacterized protein n=1 Tax=Actinomadura viridis TaxID=58110 RepID=A0A931DGE7_9ACTN|nr:hypothetical protein [Actinomadura viridis]MBG6086400.1 hypothetical protein [Actinomadura viridis]